MPHHGSMFQSGAAHPPNQPQFLNSCADDKYVEDLAPGAADDDTLHVAALAFPAHTAVGLAARVAD